MNRLSLEVEIQSLKAGKDIYMDIDYNIGII